MIKRRGSKTNTQYFGESKQHDQNLIQPTSTKSTVVVGGASVSKAGRSVWTEGGNGKVGAVEDC